MSDAARTTGARVAYLAAATNLAAGLVMLVALRRGIPAGEGELTRRLEYVSEHTLVWRIGWVTWMAAAITLLAFLAVLSVRWRERSPVMCTLALLCAAAGLAADLAAETILVVVAPGFRGEIFALGESIAIGLTAFLGNGLYAVAGILLTLAGRRELPQSLLALAAAVWGSALWLSAAALVSSETGQFASAAVLIPLFVLWAALTGRWLSTRAS
ncbi:MAG TPA: hypothetical protein VEC09_03685 [Actinomycetota bacterium]|nr:hypothetical protein [Actinomycetota bacterium]